MKNLSRKEAAKVLEGMKVKIEIPKAAVTQWKRNTALDMAIEALKYSEIPNSSDTIYRQDAIDAASRGCKEWRGIFEEVVTELEQLPSAQPDAIPLDWIAKHLEWLDNCDNDFAQLAKVSIRAMVEIWKKEKTQ